MEESVGSAMIKLTDQNWVTWKPRMEGILYCKDLHEPIEGDEAKPDEMTEKQWYIQNRKAIGTIIQWVDDSVFRLVAQEINAHKLWTKLELMFEKKAVTKKFFLIKDLVNMKYKEEMNMTEHLNNFQNIINQLATMGMVLENELQALLLLSSLPDGWETFIVTVSDSAANDVLSVDFVKDSMHNEETRKKNSGVCKEQMESDNQKMEDDKNTTVVVHFRALERPKEDEFCLELSENHKYVDVVERVAQHLGLDDITKVQLTPQDYYSQKPKLNPIKYRSVDLLLDMLVKYIQMRLKKEQEEKEDRRRYEEQAHLFTIIKVARDEDLKEQIGKDIYFDLVDHDKVRSFRIQKQMPFNLFKEEVAREFGIPVQFQRFWIWSKRQNHTYRPYHPLTPHEEAQTVGALREVSNKVRNNAELKLFLEVNHGQDLHPVPPPDKNKEDILLFFKLYDPEKEELRYVGRFFVKSSSTPMEILIKLNELAGFSPDEEIEMFEEIKFEPTVMCERLDRRASFRFSQIGDGDIICFQKKFLPEGEEKIRYPEVPSFLEYVKNRQISDILYEVLGIPLPELQCLKTLKVAFHHATKDEAIVLNIRLPRQSTVEDVLNEIKTKVELSHPNAELRLLEVFYHKIYKIFPPNEKIENINDQYWTLWAEEIPEEEKNLGPNSRLIHVYYFTKENAQNQVQIQNFGEPLFLVNHDGETLADVKMRIQKKLQVPDEEFSKRRDVYGAWEQYLGLEHSDTTPKRTYTANQNRHTFERAVKIYN